MDPGFLIIIAIFILYYFAVLISEKEIMSDPKQVIDKFLSILLLYAAVSLIYYSLTGKPFLTDDESSYSIYIFIIGFVALLWAVPNLLKEFGFFNKFIRKGERLKKKERRQR